jgi:hypothetical protein
VREIRRRAALHRDDQMEATGTETERHGGRVEDHRVALRDGTDELRIREGRCAVSLDVDLELDRARALGEDAEDPTAT